MNVLNPNSDDEPQECPLCMEFLELDDINFYPCSCGYQICRFCWNKIRTEGSGLCPACRSPYSENPADFKPLTPEELAKIKADKRQKDLAKKQRISENRKHLANVRVVQRNLVFVVGLSPKLADSEVLKRPEYFGRFGRIHKVVINTSTTYAGNHNQGPSASAYVTYYKSEDALRAIQAVNNVLADGRTLKASLGTTKYCSHFMKNMPCPKHDCMYLHELGDEAASFTKEEMQQGKHTEYEKNLHEELSMSSTTSVSSSSTMHNPAASMSSTLHSESSIITSSGTSTVMSARDSTGPSPTSGPGQNMIQVAPNGRATSESNSDVITSSRSPSPHPQQHHQMTNGGWPNLGMDSKKSRQYDPAPPPPQQQQQQRNPSPPMYTTTSEIMVNGNDNTSHHGQQQHRNTTTTDLKPNITPSELSNVDSGGGGGIGGGGGNIGLSKYENIKDTYKDDLFEEDDLGFDPFHETQKALAEMLESESKQQIQQQQQQREQQQHILHHQQNHLLSQQQFHEKSRQQVNNESSVSGGSPDTQINNLSTQQHNLRTQHEQSPVMNRSNPNSGGFSMAGNLRGGFTENPQFGGQQPQQNSSVSAGGNRVKQPPPGFDPLSMLNNSGPSNGQQATQRNLLSPDFTDMGLSNIGTLNLEALTSQLNLNAGFGGGHPNDLTGRHDNGGQFHEKSFGGHAGNGSHGGLLSNHHMHNGMGLGGLKTENQQQSAAIQQQQQRQQPHFFKEQLGNENKFNFTENKQQIQQPNHNKDWQDGLRALLPNVNVSFGALPHGGPAPPPQTNGTQDQNRMFSQQPNAGLLNEHHQHHHHERMQRQQHQSRTGWNSIKSPHANDWTTLDPAIVTGQVADSLSHNLAGLRADSPPGWLKSSLDQLTSTGDLNPQSSGIGGGRFSGLNGVTSNNAAGLIPGLAGLGLGGGGQGGQQQPPGGPPPPQLGGHHWGQPSPVMSNTPPPGFALNRGQMGVGLSGQPSSVSQPHPFSALATLGGGGNASNGGVQDRDAHLESELARLVRS